MKNSKLNPIGFDITGEKLFWWFVYFNNILDNFTSRAGCNKICSQKYYLWGYPSVDDMTMLREREIDQGNEQFYSV